MPSQRDSLLMPVVKLMVEWLGKLAGRMLDAVFLYEGGAKYYVSFGDERMPVGAVVSNRGRHAVSTSVDAHVSDADGNAVWRRSFEVDVAPPSAEPCWP